jgi:hypothetical protein
MALEEFAECWHRTADDEEVGFGYGPHIGWGCDPRDIEGAEEGREVDHSDDGCSDGSKSTMLVEIICCSRRTTYMVAIPNMIPAPIFCPRGIFNCIIMGIGKTKRITSEIIFTTAMMM